MKISTAKYSCSTLKELDCEITYGYGSDLNIRSNHDLWLASRVMDTPLVPDTLTPADSNPLISLVALWPSRHASGTLTV